MPEKIFYPHIAKYRAQLVEKRSEFAKQMREVEQRYPLVGMAYRLLEAMFVQSPMYYTEIGSLYAEISPTIDEELATRIRVNTTRAIRNLEACLGRSHTFEEGKACMDQFAKDFRNASKPD